MLDFATRWRSRESGGESARETVSIPWLRPGNASFLGLTGTLASVGLGIELSGVPHEGIWLHILGLGALYVFGALSLNHTKLSRTATELRIASGPVPFAPQRTIGLAGKVRFEMTQDVYSSGRSMLLARSGATYGIDVVDGAGRRRVLSDLEYEHAENIIRTLAS